MSGNNAESSKSGKASQYARDVVISHEPTELYKILKFESMVNSGGQAKTVIADGAVRLNGEIETQKRKKIMSGDIIEFNGERVVIRLAAPGDTGSAPAARPNRKVWGK